MNIPTFLQSSEILTKKAVVTVVALKLGAKKVGMTNGRKRAKNDCLFVLNTLKSSFQASTTFCDAGALQNFKPGSFAV